MDGKTYRTQFQSLAIDQSCGWVNGSNSYIYMGVEAAALS